MTESLGGLARRHDRYALLLHEEYEVVIGIVCSPLSTLSDSKSSGIAGVLLL